MNTRRPQPTPQYQTQQMDQGDLESLFEADEWSEAPQQPQQPTRLIRNPQNTQSRAQPRPQQQTQPPRQPQPQPQQTQIPVAVPQPQPLQQQQQPIANAELPRKPLARQGTEYYDSEQWERQDGLPKIAVFLMPWSSSFLIVAAGKLATSTLTGPGLLLAIALSPLVFPWFCLSVLGICQWRDFKTARTITVTLLLGWAIALPFQPIFLMPLKPSIPSLPTPEGTVRDPATPAQPN